MNTKSISILLSLAALIWTAGCCSPSKCCPGSCPARTVELFNGRDLAGWTHVLMDPSVKMDEVWSVRDGMIVCKGEPVGFISAGPEVTNFRLVVEYRWAPGAKPGNSGLFSRIHEPIKALPACVETQLQHGNAGDVMGLQGVKIDQTQPRSFFVAKHELAGDIAGVKKIADKEKAPGEWNHVEIEARGTHYRVWMNGELINDVFNVEECAGRIGLQSEGGEVHFRKVTLTRL